MVDSYVKTCYINLHGRQTQSLIYISVTYIKKKSGPRKTNCNTTLEVSKITYIEIKEIKVTLHIN